MWFKARYVEPIIRGEKTETLRAVTVRFPPPGTIVPASVGPRTPFAHLLIESVTIVAVDELSAAKVTELSRLLGPQDAYRRIQFRVVTLDHQSPHIRSASDRGIAEPTERNPTANRVVARLLVMCRLEPPSRLLNDPFLTSVHRDDLARDRTIPG